MRVCIASSAFFAIARDILDMSARERPRGPAKTLVSVRDWIRELPPPPQVVWLVFSSGFASVGEVPRVSSWVSASGHKLLRVRARERS